MNNVILMFRCIFPFPFDVEVHKNRFIHPILLIFYFLYNLQFLIKIRNFKVKAPSNEGAFFYNFLIGVIKFVFDLEAGICFEGGGFGCVFPWELDVVGPK